MEQKKYFTNVYAGDKIPYKPLEDSYTISKGKYDFTECLIIGDNLKNDYLIPMKCGMKAILYDKANCHHADFVKVNNLNDLKKYL